MVSINNLFNSKDGKALANSLKDDEKSSSSNTGHASAMSAMQQIQARLQSQIQTMRDSGTFNQNNSFRSSTSNTPTISFGTPRRQRRQLNITNNDTVFNDTSSFETSDTSTNKEDGTSWNQSSSLKTLMKRYVELSIEINKPKQYDNFLDSGQTVAARALKNLFFIFRIDPRSHNLEKFGLDLTVPKGEIARVIQMRQEEAFNFSPPINHSLYDESTLSLSIEELLKRADLMEEENSILNVAAYSYGRNPKEMAKILRIIANKARDKGFGRVSEKGFEKIQADASRNYNPYKGDLTYEQGRIVDTVAQKYGYFYLSGFIQEAQRQAFKRLRV